VKQLEQKLSTALAKHDAAQITCQSLEDTAQQLREHRQAHESQVSPSDNSRTAPPTVPVIELLPDLGCDVLTACSATSALPKHERLAVAAAVHFHLFCMLQRDPL